MKLSLVVPCYNEEGNIRAFYTEAKRVFDAEDYEYEIVFVNDGSKDKTQEELEKVYNLHEANIVIEMFSRNFGKEAAIYAGFQKASGDPTGSKSRDRTVEEHIPKHHGIHGIYQERKWKASIHGYGEVLSKITG